MSLLDNSANSCSNNSALHSEIFSYRNQSVRDLVSVLLAPALVDAWVGRHLGTQFESSPFEVLGSSWGTDLYEKNLSRLRALDESPAEFEAWLLTHQKTRRLGYYFEQLIEWTLKNFSDVKNLERSLQIKGADDQTQGELDFWFELNSKPIHLEVAIKFYLETDEGFVGPDVTRSQDRLDTKWDRLRNLQTQILETPAGKKWLNLRGIPQGAAVTKQILLKGHLFSRKEWGRVDELDRLISKTTSRYEHLDRPRWLSPAVQSPGSPRLWSLEELRSHAREKLFLGVRPWLIVEHELQTHAGVTAYFEKNRFFVVPNGWTSF